jgi:hypothetical protein
MLDLTAVLRRWEDISGDHITLSLQNISEVNCLYIILLLELMNQMNFDLLVAKPLYF